MYLLKFNINNIIDLLKNIALPVIKFKEKDSMRKEANKIREKIVKVKGESIINKKLLKEIKQYSKNNFGKRSYWPYLALYTEIRGNFLHGWIPEDYYNVHLLPEKNKDPFKSLSSYKSFDKILFGDFSLESILIIREGKIYSSNHELLSIEKAQDLVIECCSEVVVKPDSGRAGKGIKFVDSEELNLSEIIKNGDYVIQPVLKQHQFLKDIYPHSLNTIRVFTSFSENKKLKVKCSYLKFGVKGSRVDNSSAGGLFCKINSEGELDNKIYDKNYIEYGEMHPETKVKLTGMRIPNYADIIKKCIAAHKKLHNIYFIGWDVAISEDGTPKLIEWNANYPALMTIEALYGPLFKKIPSI